MTWLVYKEIAQICLQNVLIQRLNVFFIYRKIFYLLLNDVGQLGSCQNYDAK